MKKYLISFLLLVALFAGCSKSDPNYTWETKSKLEVSNFLNYTNKMHAMYGPQLTSDTYCIPEERWVEEKFRPSLKEFLSLNNIPGYSIPDNDCVRYSSYGFAVGGIIHANGEGPRKTSLAIGIIDYTRSLDSWHSINFFVVKNKFNDLEVYYFEPQTGERIPNDDVDTQWWSIRM